jgi:hypothetical protein
MPPLALSLPHVGCFGRFHSRLIVFVLQEDQRQLNHLLQKVKAQSDVVDRHGAAGVKAAELSALKPIVDKVGITNN